VAKSSELYPCYVDSVNWKKPQVRALLHGGRIQSVLKHPWAEVEARHEKPEPCQECGCRSFVKCIS